MDEQYAQLNEGNAGNPEQTPFGMNVSDDELVTTINTWVKESVSFHDTMLIYQNLGVRYYLGDQTDRADIPTYNSDTVYNRIFEATETIVPIVTGTAHQFIAIPGEENELSLKKAKKLQKVLTAKYEDLEIQRKLENITRDIILKRFGVAKWYWNTFTDDVDVKVVDPRLILIPKLRMDANDPELPYVIEVQEYTRDEMKTEFPDVDEKDLVFGRQTEISTVSAISSPSLPGYQNLAPTYQVLEVTTNEYKCWKQGTKILKKIKNPYWDFDGEEKSVKKKTPNGKVIETKYKVMFNHLPYPTKEYVFFNPFTTGDAPVAETSLAEVAIPIQDDINTQKRQIINNLIRMGNGQIYIDQDAIPKELEDQITSEPGLIVVGKNLVSENRIRREQGTPLPAAHFANIQDSIVAFDNVFGTQAALRGADAGGTLGGQILNRQQNLSRIEQLTRCLNRGVARIADGLVQMMRMYYDVDHVFKILGRDGAIEFMRFNRNDIEDNVVVNVKSGTPPTMDPVTRYNQAIQLWQLGALDPETLFERLEFADPQTAAQKLAAWKQGQLLMQSDIKQKEALALREIGAEAPETEVPETPDEGERDVETPGNVIARAQETIRSAGAAPLQNTPNGGNPEAIA